MELIGNRYQLMDIIGQGGMGAVYRARDRLTDTPVALKRVHVPLQQLQHGFNVANDSTAQMAIAQEFRTLASLRHPNIISVLDYGFEVNRQPFFTMELLEDTQTIENAAVSRNRKEKILLLVQVLQALVYLHRRNIVHRDLKPGNVLVDKLGRVKVLDFGLAVRANFSAQVAGSIAYIAPEVLLERPAVAASDLYAVGVMAYEFFTGRHPFETRSISIMISGTISKPPPIEPLLSSDAGGNLIEVIERLLEKDPTERYQDAQEVIRDLYAAVPMPPPPEDQEIRESFLQSAAFVGRELELRQLEIRLEDTLRGEGSAWLVGGESGVGKSRLMEELRTRALIKGAAVLRGQSLVAGGSPYHLWRDIVRRLALLTAFNDAEAGILREVVPDIERLLEREVPEVPELTGEENQQRIGLTLVDICRRVKQPMVFLLEDLHRAGETLTLLRYLSRAAQKLPMLIIGSFRNDEEPYFTSKLPDMEVMLLRRLAKEDIAALTAAILGPTGERPGVIERLNKETEGNAYFIVEVLRELAKGLERLSDVGTALLPDTIFAGGILRLAERRLRRLSEDDRAILQLAATMGREIDPKMLQFLAATPDYDQWLLRCADAAVLEVHEQTWRFTHDKMREGIMHNLSPERRRELHRQVAEAIEVLYPNDADYFVALYRHWLAAGVLENAARCAADVARQANNVGDYQTARRICEQTLNFPLTLNYPLRVTLQTALGNACAAVGEYQRATNAYDTALTFARRMGTRPREADALKGLGMVYENQGKYAEARSSIQDSLKLYQALADKIGQVDCLTALGTFAWQQGNYDEAQTRLEESLTLCRRIDYVAGLVTTLNHLGRVAGYKRDFTRARAAFDECLGIEKQLHNRNTHAGILLNLALMEFLREDFPAALNLQRQCLDLYRELDNRYGIASTRNDQGLVYLAMARMSDARAAFYEGLNLGSSLNTLPVQLTALIGFARWYAGSGDHYRAAELLGLVDAQSALTPVMRDFLLPPLRDTLAAALSAETLKVALDVGKERDLRRTVTETLLTMRESSG
jgi:tetratricopeptide (TPR) repeat protein